MKLPAAFVNASPKATDLFPGPYTMVGGKKWKRKTVITAYHLDLGWGWREGRKAGTLLSSEVTGQCSAGLPSPAV